MKMGSTANVTSFFFFFFLCIIQLFSLPYGQLVQCLNDTCEATRNGKTKSISCEPRNNAVNVAAVASVSVSPKNATCGTPKVKFCGLKNGLSCLTCDASRKGNRHEPVHMIDGIQWTWWQSRPRAGLDYKAFEINITLNLPKVFILTDDIIITFHDGQPDVMIVEKSGDYGVTWSVLQYFARNCFEEFNMLRTNVHRAFDSIGDALSPICTQDYSTNRAVELINGVTPVFVTERLNALKVNGMNEERMCSELHSKRSEFRSFLEITNLRIRLLRPPVLEGAWGSASASDFSDHYGIRKVEIPARCQCNGHASDCLIDNGTAKCACRHNTGGTECQECKPLFWMYPWRRGSYAKHNSGSGNPCISFYSSHYRSYWSEEGTYNRTDPSRDPVPPPCYCYGHSKRCELVRLVRLNRTETACVDCRHNTAGLNCHLCRPGYFRKRCSLLEDPNMCQACACDAIGSFYRRCDIRGVCRCRAGFCGKKCDKCKPGYELRNRTCLRIRRQTNTCQTKKACHRFCTEQLEKMCKKKAVTGLGNPLTSCEPISSNVICQCPRSVYECTLLTSSRRSDSGGGAARGQYETNSVFLSARVLLSCFVVVLYSLGIEVL